MKNLKTYEEFSYEKSEVIKEGVFSFTQKDIKKLLDKGEDIENIFKRTFAEALKKGAILKAAEKTSKERKQELVMEALNDPDGIGSLALKGSELIYVSKKKVNYAGVASGISGSSLK